MSTTSSEPRFDPTTAVPQQVASHQQAQPTPPATQMEITDLPAAANGVPTSVFGFALVVIMLSLVDTGILSTGSLLVPLFMVIGFLTAFWLATGVLLNTMHGKDMMQL